MGIGGSKQTGPADALDPTKTYMSKNVERRRKQLTALQKKKLSMQEQQRKLAAGITATNPQINKLQQNIRRITAAQQRITAEDPIQRSHHETLRA